MLLFLTFSFFSQANPHTKNIQKGKDLNNGHNGHNHQKNLAHSAIVKKAIGKDVASKPLHSKKAGHPKEPSQKEQKQMIQLIQKHMALKNKGKANKLSSQDKNSLIELFQQQAVLNGLNTRAFCISFFRIHS